MLGLHKDPSHFPSIPPITAEIRRRIWWHTVHVDVSVAIASGLPPMIEASIWDVRAVSELKEEYIGTPEGERYEREVEAGTTKADSTDDYGLPEGPEGERGGRRKSFVSIAGVLSRGKLNNSLLMRRILSRIFGQKALSREDIIGLRAECVAVAVDMEVRIERITQPSVLGASDSNATAADAVEGFDVEYYTSFAKWSRQLLAAITDRRWVLVLHPLLKEPVRKIWAGLEPQ